MINKILIYIKNEGVIKFIFYIFIKSKNVRKKLSLKYIRGIWLEIWAFWNPLFVDNSIAKVKYVDYLHPAEIKKINLWIKNENNVKIDFLCRADNLLKIEDYSQDFIIANHLFEHLNNPIKALIEWERVLKKEWILFLTIPDKRRTFDKNRNRTTIKHIIEDFKDPSVKRDLKHYEEFALISMKEEWWKDNINDEVKRLIETNYSIHYHVYLEEDIKDILEYWKNENLFNFNILETKHTSVYNIADIEFTFILQKNINKEEKLIIQSNIGIK